MKLDYKASNLICFYKDKVQRTSFIWSMKNTNAEKLTTKRLVITLTEKQGLYRKKHVQVTEYVDIKTTGDRV